MDTVHKTHCLGCGKEVLIGEACRNPACQDKAGEMIAGFEAGIPSVNVEHFGYTSRYTEPDADARVDPFKNGWE
jgi:hypothetical protein